MADNQTKKQKAVSDWINRPHSESAYAAAATRRNELREAINKFVTANGAWVVSLPNAPCLRVEMRQGSGLVSKLTAAGFNPTIVGSGTRLASGGVIETIAERGGKQTTRLHDGLVPVDVVEITL